MAPDDASRECPRWGIPCLWYCALDETSNPLANPDDCARSRLYGPPRRNDNGVQCRNCKWILVGFDNTLCVFCGRELEPVTATDVARLRWGQPGVTEPTD